MSGQFVCAFLCGFNLRNTQGENNESTELEHSIKDYIYIIQHNIIQIYSGITRGRVLNGELYMYKDYRS